MIHLILPQTEYSSFRTLVIDIYQQKENLISLSTYIQKKMNLLQASEDVVQETLLKLQAIDDDKAMGIPNKVGYLIRCLKNKAIDTMRKSKEDCTISLSDLKYVERLGEGNTVLETSIYLSLEAKVLWKQIEATLTIRQLSILKSSLKGYSRKEMADYFQISPNTVRNTLLQSQTLLRKNLRCL